MCSIHISGGLAQVHHAHSAIVEQIRDPSASSPADEGKGKTKGKGKGKGNRATPY